jgi:hypothetical protein
MPLILGTNSIKDTGYEVANSCRFNRADGAYMHKTPGSAGNQKTMTFSCWVKRSQMSAETYFLLSAGVDASNRDAILYQDQTIRVLSQRNESDYWLRSTTRVFRDPSAWTHIVVSIDTTQGTDSNRIKIYINGTQETTFNTYAWGDAYPAEDFEMYFNDDLEQAVGSYAQATPGNHFDGYMAEVVMIDGTAYAASDFGEFDEDSPNIWKPKDVSGLTFGTNGFYLDFEDSANLGNDANGGTDLTEVNLAATDQATDTPTNNFCTMNAVGSHGSVTLAEGNIQVNVANNTDNASGTFFVDKGKWYVELKYTAQESGDDLIMFGIRPDTMNIYQDNLFNLTGTGQGLYYYGDNGNQRPANTSYGSAVALNDILGVYIDLDNNKLYFAINGTVQASGTGISIPTTSDYYTFSFTSGGQSDTAQVNFGGCPTYTISSGNADANGYGNFEYDPSAGTFDSASKDFYSLCTKNLAEFG